MRSFDADLGATVISIHYAGIAEKLNQSVLASALFNGFAVRKEFSFRRRFGNSDRASAGSVSSGATFGRQTTRPAVVWQKESVLSVDVRSG